ncbi:PVC-type heme-binding CxxCH protein [Novipirellula artificiosorum]|uniref:Cytochrome c n=1 Tax=Novipirellula artificiosorum TaxID=2528016 RepID=A0A5C6E4W3_9BACT|nr:PVC-type heme-binding CxxCH protein [Novipirellula artificiosorum]TWU42621.1 Cytochrome c [Novipirellula artificiosorum]
MKSCVLLTLLVFTPTAILFAVEPPRVLDADWQIELVAAEPDLVTPVGLCFDGSGRLLVIESNTHFPPDDYDGPKTDRVFVFDDTKGDGFLDRQRLFYEGGIATMDITPLDDNWIALSTRREVVRIRDTNGDDVADEREVLLTLETDADYPHNGLNAVTVGPDRRLYVGQGENFGEPYSLVAADGSTQVGSGEGGNVFSISFDGSDLQRVATGFWNPFGLWFDKQDRLWAVGNDPDAMPPCRLLHVIPCADYGFQFRFGRAGTHPLQSWNGELPGTLGRVAGTGEAPCAVVGYGEHLWVTAWGDNRIERYKLEESGASWQSRTEVVVQGDARFRPVDMAVAADGSIYITDWVDRSYPVHGQGRLWRMSRRQNAPPILATLPERTAAESESLRLMNDPSLRSRDRVEALRSRDPFLRQAAMAGLVRTGQLKDVDGKMATRPLQRVGLMTAWRWESLSDPNRISTAGRNEWIEWGLSDPSAQVTLAAVRWATECQCREMLPKIRSLLDREDLSPSLFNAVIASIAFLETGSAASGKRDPAIEKTLIEFASEQDRPASLRALAIQKLASESDVPSDAELGRWLRGENDRDFSREVVRLLAERAKPTSLAELATIAMDSSLDEQTRADALASLSKNAGTYSSVFNQLVLPKQSELLRTEAKRVLKHSWQYDADKRPPNKQVAEWLAALGNGGDPDAGRRVFYRSACASCHAHSGRGATTGPDLTTLSGRMTRRRILESILEPSREVAPLYVPWRVLTVDGHVLTGLKLGESGVRKRLRFQGADGITFEVPLDEIEQQDPITQSIMPAGLEELMSIAELRDLLAFLESRPE